MVSALIQEGADVTLQALELGAVDFMPNTTLSVTQESAPARS
jgi:chemotaxis response regulator CheB